MKQLPFEKFLKHTLFERGVVRNKRYAFLKLQARVPCLS